MDYSDSNQGLLDFLNSSPSPFHAVATMATHLKSAGFVFLPEITHWDVEPGGRYFTTRNDSSLIAFRIGESGFNEDGIRMIGAHTDSPCLKVRPNPEKSKDYFQLGVEVYGGVLLNPWFDRDLSLAGRVVYRGKRGTLESRLLDFKRPIAVIPSLAIHLDREANSNRTVNPQTDIPPILFTCKDGREESFRGLLASELKSQSGDDVEVIDYELNFYDCQDAAVVGFHDDFIASARLDNLLSCYTGLRALIEAPGSKSALLVCTDHEEVGSASACGAQGPMLESLLQRLLPDAAQRAQVIAASMMISADNAHGVHPNYNAKHDAQHGPLLNAGPVIKVNANQRYATNSVTAARFRELCEQQQVPVQHFVVRADMGCGSTIGPITASEIGVQTLDVGVPTFAMHSIRELAGSADAAYLKQVLSAFCGADHALGLVQSSA